MLVDVDADAAVDVDGAPVSSVGQVPHIIGHSSRATAPINALLQRSAFLQSPGLSSCPLQSTFVAPPSTTGSGEDVDEVVVVVISTSASPGVHISGHAALTTGPTMGFVQNIKTYTPLPH